MRDRRINQRPGAARPATPPAGRPAAPAAARPPAPPAARPAAPRLLASAASLGTLVLSVALAAGAAAPVAAAIALNRTYETVEFLTFHGRALVLTLVANFGAIKQVHAFLPVLSHAIEEAAEAISGDPSAYLRGEMREHYRLRGEGV